MSDCSIQVAQLRVENTTLVKRLTDISQKFSDAAVDNRVLKSDVEALRAKVHFFRNNFYPIKICFFTFSSDVGHVPLLRLRILNLEMI